MTWGSSEMITLHPVNQSYVICLMIPGISWDDIYGGFMYSIMGEKFMNMENETMNNRDKQFGKVSFFNYWLKTYYQY